MIEISICPTCGSNKIKKVKRDWTHDFKGEVYTVPDLEYHECPDCGERVYDRRPCAKSKRIRRRMRKSELEKKPHDDHQGEVQ